MGVICVLPARLSSTRIPRKPLQDLAGRPLVEWTWRTARRVSEFDRVVIATDSPEVGSVARGFGAEVVMTRSDHGSGTDRVEEAAAKLDAGEGDVVVNFQADEPFVDVVTMGGAVRRLRTGTEAGPAIPDIVTLAAPIGNREEWRSQGAVKVVRAADGWALYFSRAPVPHVRDGQPSFGGAGAIFLRHIGVYAMTRPALRRWSGLGESPLEAAEKLEQLRALEAGMRIHVEVGPVTEPGVDLPADLERAERVLTG